MRTTKTLAIFATSLVSGCTGLTQTISTHVDNTESKVSRLVRDVGRVESRGQSDSVVVHENGIWIGKNIIKRSPVSLPAMFYEQATFDRSISSLTELAERITLRSGIPTKIAPDALQAFTRAAQSAGNANNPLQPNSALSMPQTMAAPFHGGAGANNPMPIRITYSGGTFKGLLDTVTARFGIFWKYVDGIIQFYYTDTRSFQISAVPGDAALTATVTSGATATADGGGTGGSSGGVSSNNSNNTAVKTQLSVYSSLEKAISVMLSPYGSVVASPATGSITVSDTPDRLANIEKFIEKENKALSRQVMINVTILGVTLSSNDSYGINWNLVYGDLERKYGINNTRSPDAGSTSFSAAILNTASSKSAGTSMVIDALSQQGKVRRETSASVVTLNNQPVPVQVAKQTSYLKSSQTTLTSNVGSSTTLTPGTVTSGFNMSILPTILSNGTVVMQFSTDISSLRNIRKVSSSNGSIETPEIDTRNFLQRVAMRSDETLVISGFEQTDDNLDQQGIGTPTNLLLGGGVKAQTSKELIVILITPIVM